MNSEGIFFISANLKLISTAPKVPPNTMNSDGRSKKIPTLAPRAAENPFENSKNPISKIAIKTRPKAANKSNKRIKIFFHLYLNLIY